MAARSLVPCCALLLAACGAGDTRIDPGELELRDLLGISPEVAVDWDPDQRAAARRAIDQGLKQSGEAPLHGSLAPGERTDRRVARALTDAARDTKARGLVRVSIERDDMVATPRASIMAPLRAHRVELRFEGWDAKQPWGALPSRGVDVLAGIAADAGHLDGPVVIAAVPRLAVVAAYTPGEPARLLVNPVLLAALEPVPGGAALALVAPANPYSFYRSIAECAAVQRDRCTECLVDSSCKAITGGDGNTECTHLGSNSGRGYSLICINLAMAIDSVERCAADRARTCDRDPRASESLASLENNAGFLDDSTCAATLDQCLDSIFGSTPDPGTPDPPADSSCDDSSCEEACAGDGAACAADESTSCDCSDSGDSSGCEDSGDSSGCESSDSGGDCGDSEDACGSSDNSGCSDSGGGDCGGDSGGDCDSGGGDTQCSVAAPSGRRAGGGLIIAVLWALLPLPFAAAARRRAERRRAWAAHRDEVSS